MIMKPHKKTIAIADKEIGLADLIGVLTRDMGVEVHKMVVGSNTTPQDVASFVQGVSPDMVFLAENYQTISTVPMVLAYQDIKRIKRGEGVEALAEIRKGGYTGPVYMISANPQHEEEAMAQGADGYVPMDFEKLREFLK